MKERPRISAVVHADGTGEVTVGTDVRTVAAEDVEQARARIVTLVAAEAADYGAPLSAAATDPDGRAWLVLIHPDGAVTPGGPGAESEDEGPESALLEVDRTEGPVGSDGGAVGVAGAGEAAPAVSGQESAESEPAAGEAAPAVPGPDAVAPGAPAASWQESVAPESPVAQRGGDHVRENPAPPASSQAAPQAFPPARQPPPPERERVQAPAHPPSRPAPTRPGASVPQPQPMQPNHHRFASQQGPMPTTAPPSGPPQHPGPNQSRPSPRSARPVPHGHTQAQYAGAGATAARPPGKGWRIAVLGAQPQIGTTTTVAGIGAALAGRFSEGAVALDTHPHGPLADRFLTRVPHTMTDMARAGDRVDSVAVLRAYLGSSPGGLYVLSGRGGLADYERAAATVERFTPATVTDCRADPADPMVKAVLNRSTHCVLALGSTPETTASGQALWQWLTSEYPALARTGTVAISSRTTKASAPQGVAEWFAAQTVPVVAVPFDRHLQRGGVIDPERLRRATRGAYESLVATVTSR